MKPRVIHTQSFVADAVKIIHESAQAALEERGAFRISLSGGSTPAPIYAELAKRGAGLPWDKIQVTFGDERCVPPDDPQSNYRMANETLLSAVPIPIENIFRMRGEAPPDEAAADYEARLAGEAAKSGEELYTHDLLLLGLGDDGHTASLFPETAALQEMERSVVANFVPKFSAHRITFTYPLINAARHVCFLVQAENKSSIVEAIQRGGSGFPAERVAPDSGCLTWLLGF
jgi:6-phosphogluconolactonase